MLEIDGARGEGGGQVVRTTVALAAATGTQVRMTNVRAGRSNPGLRHQHCTAVRACADITGARLEGVEIGSRNFEFRDPGKPRSGEWTWSVGTAGSVTLVLQSLLPPLLRADGESRVTVEGGTHTFHAPIWEHFERSFAPFVERTGATIEAHLETHGFPPVGGGRGRLRVVPPDDELARLEVPARTSLHHLEATSLLADLPGHIARRELETFANRLPVYEFERRAREIESSASPGNVLFVEIESDAGTVLLSEMGRKGLPAERVAERLADRTETYLASGAAVDDHLADQLLLPAALAGGGSFTTPELTSHGRTQLDLLPEFLDVETTRQPRGDCIELRIESP